MNDFAVSNGGDGAGRDSGGGAGALTVADQDPERIAYNLWNEGRVDEAIEFLESQIVTERQRRRQSRANVDVQPAGLTGWDATLEPASSWRERHRNALSATDFNAFGAPVTTIDVTPVRADAIAPPRSRSRRMTWLMGLGMAVLGVSGASVWLAAGEKTADEPMLASVATPATGDDLRSGAPEIAGPNVEIALATPDAPSDVPPPEAAGLDVAPDAAVEPLPTAGEPPPEDAVEASGWDPVEPESTASITPALDLGPSSEAPAVEARLPRQRPEPPAGLRHGPTETAMIEPEIVYDTVPEPEPLQPEPLPANGQPFTQATLPAYGQAFAQPTLTPAEYQALLERRAWAQEYASRRRAFAERRAEYAPPVILPPAYRLP